jgi:hypothetical protein
LPIKKDSLLAFLAVNHVIAKRRLVYKIKIPSIRNGGIFVIFIYKVKKKNGRQKITPC